LFSLFKVISHFVNFFDKSWILNLPCFIILFFEKLCLLLVKDSLAVCVFELGSLSKQECFLEAGSALLSLVLELTVQSVVDHVALMDRKLTGHFYEVADSLVKVSELRNLSLLKDGFLQVVQFCAKTEILVGKPLGRCFDGFASFRNLSINTLVVVIESLKAITEQLGHVGGLAKNLSS
jgi:hypothetical protein